MGVGFGWICCWNWWDVITGWRRVDVHSEELQLLLPHIFQSHQVRPAHTKTHQCTVFGNLKKKNIFGWHKKKKSRWHRGSFSCIRALQHLQVGALSDVQLHPGSVAQPMVMDEQETCRRWRCRSAWRFNIACSPPPRRSAVGAGNRCGLSVGDSSSVAARQFSRSAASRYGGAEEKTGERSLSLSLRHFQMCLDRKSHQRCNILNYVATACHVRTEGFLWNGDTSTRMCGYGSRHSGACCVKMGLWWAAALALTLSSWLSRLFVLIAFWVFAFCAYLRSRSHDE